MPEDYGPLYQAAGTQWNVSPLLLQAMAGQESGEGRNLGPSSAGARGFMQFMPDTAAEYGVDVNDTTSSIYGAANKMADLLNRHKGNTRLALAEYYSGNKNPDPNSAYVNDVMGRFTQLHNAWGMTESAKNFRPPIQAPDTFGDEGQFPRSFQAQAAAAPTGPPITLKGADAAPAPAAAQPAASPEAAEKPITLRGAEPAGMDTGQYLSTGKSPGAQAVGKPIAEDRVPGPGFQAALNIPTDPAQRARVAADQLGIPLDNIIVGPEGRMAAVGKDGKPYYIEPRPSRAINVPQTRPGPPGTPWESTVLDIRPWAAPLVSPGTLVADIAADPGNMLRAGGALIPGTLQNALTMIPAGVAEAAGGPALGATVAGLATGVTSAGRQGIANLMDPTTDRSKVPPMVTGDTAKDAVTAGLGWRAASMLNPFAAVGQRGQGLFAPGEADRIGRSGFPGFNRSMPAEGNPATGERLAPWEPRPPAPPGSGGATGTVHLNPLGEAAEASGAYAPTSAAEAKGHEIALSTLPPQRLPLVRQSQIEARADQIYRHMAANGNVEADMRDLVPDSPATMGGRTGNAGLNALERWLRNEPDMKNIFDSIDARQHVARTAHTARLIGNPDELESLQAARSAQTAQLRQDAFASTTPTDPSAAVAEIDKVLAGPEGKREGVAGPLRRLRDSFYTTDADGKRALESNPEMLYGVRKNITDSLGPLARGTEKDASAAAAHLQPVLRKLDHAIEDGAPGFREYMDRFNQLSKPIDAMEYLLRRNMTDATTGAPTLAKVDQTIKDIEKRRLLPGSNDAKSISDDQLDGLKALRDDLRRSANLGKGKALGSNTAENLAGGSFLNHLTGPAAGLVGRGVGAYFGSWPGMLAAQGVEGMGGSVNVRAQKLLKEALLRRVFNEDGAGVRALRGAGAAPPMSYSGMPPGPPAAPPPRVVPPPLRTPANDAGFPPQ